MSRFFVGQRVRIVSCGNPKMAHHVGKEGHIQSASDEYPGNWVVSPALTTSNGRPCSWRPFRLEPILPEGHQPADLTLEELLPFLREKLTS